MAMAVLVTLAASPALPHSSVETTVPENGAVLEQAPAQVVLTFADGLRLTKVLMSHNDGPEVELDPGSQTGFVPGSNLPSRIWTADGIASSGAGCRSTDT